MVVNPMKLAKNAIDAEKITKGLYSLDLGETNRTTKEYSTPTAVL